MTYRTITLPCCQGASRQFRLHPCGAVEQQYTRVHGRTRQVQTVVRLVSHTLARQVRAAAAEFRFEE